MTAAEMMAAEMTVVSLVSALALVENLMVSEGIAASFPLQGCFCQKLVASEAALRSYPEAALRLLESTLPIAMLECCRLDSPWTSVTSRLEYVEV